MNARCFCDTNVCLYALRAEETEKAERAMSVLALGPTISTQVLGETARTMLGKFKYEAAAVTRELEFLRSRCDIRIVEFSEYTKALELYSRYSFSFWDSLIVATAIRSECSLLLSEDMQDGLIIDGSLTIKNPFH